MKKTAEPDLAFHTHLKIKKEKEEMKKTTFFVAAIAAFTMLACLPAFAVNWVQVGTTLTDTYSSPENTLWTNISDALGDVPSELAISGGVIPNLKVTYHLTCDGVDPTLHGYQTAGRKGLAIFAGSTPAINDALFSGLDIYWENSYYGALAGPAGNPAPGGTVLQSLSDWANAGYPHLDFDITFTVVDGVATTTATSNGWWLSSTKTYAISSDDISSWAGQMKFAVYRADANYSQTFVDNIKFYADMPEVPEPGSLLGLAVGLMSAGAFIMRRRRS